MKQADPSNHPDYLRPPHAMFAPDPRADGMLTLDGTGFRARTREDHHSAVSVLVLHEGVPEHVRITFETSKNVYLYAWHVYRFYSVCRLHVYSCLEFALRERFGRELYEIERQRNRNQRRQSRKKRRLPERYEDYGPGLHKLLRHAETTGLIKNDGFQAYRIRQQAREHERTVIEEIARREGRTVVWDHDPDADFVAGLIRTIPRIRNEYAHGTKALDSFALAALRTVSEIINQVYPPSVMSDAAR